MNEAANTDENCEVKQVTGRRQKNRQPSYQKTEQPNTQLGASTTQTVVASAQQLKCSSFTGFARANSVMRATAIAENWYKR